MLAELMTENQIEIAKRLEKECLIEQYKSC